MSARQTNRELQQEFLDTGELLLEGKKVNHPGFLEELKKGRSGYLLFFSLFFVTFFLAAFCECFNGHIRVELVNGPLFISYALFASVFSLFCSLVCLEGVLTLAFISYLLSDHERGAARAEKRGRPG
jgi:hypothetical protein